MEMPHKRKKAQLPNVLEHYVTDKVERESRGR